MRAVCIAVLACILALLSGASALTELDFRELPVQTTFLETGETVLTGCWREAKRLCFQQKARCRTECNQIEDDLAKAKESSASLLETNANIPDVVPHLDGVKGAKPCDGKKCSSLYQSCYKVHAEACGFRKNDHIQWSTLKDVNTKAEAHRNGCVKKLRNRCRKARVRCEKECLEDKADSKATGGSEEDACDPAKCKNLYVSCRESMQVAERMHCMQSLIKPQQVPGLFECRDPDNCKTPWEKPKAGCDDNPCAQSPSASSVSSCEDCDKARILCYDECGGKIDGKCDINKRDCQREHRKCHFTCPWKPALTIDQADVAGKGGRALLRVPIKGNKKNCGCPGSDEQCLKKSPCYDPNSVSPVMVPRGTLPQPGLAGQDGLMAASVRAGKARRDEERAEEQKSKAEEKERVSRLRKWRKQRSLDAKKLAQLKAAASKAADKMNAKSGKFKWAKKNKKAKNSEHSHL